MKPRYFRVEDMIAMIDEPNRTSCLWILFENRELFQTAPGASHNHQNWPGGYIDHIQEVMNIAVLLYEAMSAARPLPFSVSDALLVLYLHDLEKPWRFETIDGKIVKRSGMKTKAEKEVFRIAKLAEYGIVLTSAQANAFKFVEGEKDDYSGERRTMNELAAFCHLCDTTSARIWHDHPMQIADPWNGARRPR